MAEKCEVEIFVLVDADGDSVIGVTEQDARDNYEADIQPLAECNGFRIVKVTVQVPLPCVQELPAIEVPEIPEATAV
jgi:hypothetical protein